MLKYEGCTLNVISGMITVYNLVSFLSPFRISATNHYVYIFLSFLFIISSLQWIRLRKYLK